MSTRLRAGLLLLGSTALLAAANASDPKHVAPARTVRYDRDVRPILADRCFTCHGADANQRAAKLRLDVEEDAFADRGGYAAIVPGKPDESELLRRIASTDTDERMPPASSNKRALSAAERETLRAWIEQGAEYEPHWSFVAPKRPATPGVRGADWCRNAVDRFVLARLEKEGLAPNPPAERDVLARRVFLDLTGLPPTPEELDRFLADARPDAYERLVDRLLSEEPYSSRHAERMAVPWLDAARYADTCGIHTDAGRSIWPWRDWVLHALRDGMPFDRFLTEQLAGDLLPNATQDQKVASGFNRNHVTTDEGGAIPAEYLVEYAVDRTATTGAVFLGLTFGCARCHDHKYDPIKQDDFYSFFAFFASNDEPGLYTQESDPKRAFEPFLAVPTDEQRAERVKLDTQLGELRTELDRPAPDETAKLQAFLAELARGSGLTWADACVTKAESTGGATLQALEDGSVRASGKNPEVDDHVITLRTDATDLRLVLVEVLADALKEGDKPLLGRFENGNVVVSGVQLEVAPVAEPEKRETIPLEWAWADFEQPDGDYAAVNLLDTTDRLGWALYGHKKSGNRAALLLAERAFGYPGGTLVTVRLLHRSEYAQHVLRRSRIALGALDTAGIARLPTTMGSWYRLGPLPAESRLEPYTRLYGPETDAILDRARNFGFGNQYWRSAPEFVDGRPNELPATAGAIFVARELYAPSDREVELSLGSDDGLVLYLDGKEVFRREVDRGLAPDQDRTKVALHRGRNVLVIKIVNTAGQAGFYFKPSPRGEELFGDLVAALLPARARGTELDARWQSGWRTLFSADYRRLKDAIAAAETRLAELDKQIPRTMVMKELDKPRDVFVLQRGEYDKADKSRPVKRAVPAALGKLPDGAPQDRRGLAQWMLAPDNPLVARVAANRLWELVFGTGIVRTSEDFGMQGEWPSHPELLDFLAVEYREKGWNTRALLKLLVTSSTYRQSSRARPELAERDPDNRMLASFPRKRLGAEAIRDQALYVSGLLVEKLGGASVRPYQPEGLWEEVAMLVSNTRTYGASATDDLWRRSLYTYWKRASPPPSLLTFDAPTREFCTIRRNTTNTPLQALVLWNDDQYVEAARELAERTLGGAGDDATRLALLFRRCTGRTPDAEESRALANALARFRDRYRAKAKDAEALLAVGMAPRAKELDPSELAAWTLVASSVLSLDSTVSRN
ncbi:MAG: PSD1 domain-containing protein [Planctomycetes bacterium]|nr:PSD1 domain-containing protein [Planctomycetota bacterium]